MIDRAPERGPAAIGRAGEGENLLIPLATEQEDPVILGVHGLRVRRGRRLVLDIPFLDLRRGEILAVIGPNGSGKSTLLQTLACLERPAEGEIYFDGQPVWRRSPGVPGITALAVRRKIAMVFQEPLLIDSTVAGNIATGLRFRGVPAREIEGEVRTWAERFGIEGLLTRSARTLSGGEAQRVSLARAFACRPEVLFLDEPFSALDAPTRAGFLQELGEALESTGTTAVFVTHDFNELQFLGDRVAVLLDGRVAQFGTRDSVLSAPGSRTVAAFLGVENLFDGRIGQYHASDLEVQLGAGITVRSRARGDSRRIAPGDQVIACLRAEDVWIAQHDHRDPRLNRLPGRVAKVTPDGGQFKVVLDCGIRMVAAAGRREMAAGMLKAGAEVCIFFDPASVHLIE